LFSQILRGAVPPKVVLALTPQPKDTSSAKLSSGYIPQQRSYKRSFIAFKPIFEPSLKKIVRGPQPTVAGALVRLGHTLARVKIWRRSTP